MKTANCTPGPFTLAAALAVAALLTAAAPAWAQCTWDWTAVPGVTGVASPTIYAMTVWDPDGSGPAHPLLIAGGEFAIAGTVGASNIAAWDGIGWAPLGTGLNGPVYALAALPTGELIAGGGFTAAGAASAGCVASWNGTSWRSMGGGMNNGVNCLTVTPDGALFAGGFFTTAGGLAANRVAKWNGTSWSALGAGLNNIVYALAAIPNGNVYAGGAFTASGSSLRTRMARWDGATWQAAGSINAVVMGLAAMADGSIAATGNFTTAGATRVNYAALSSGGGIWAPLGGTGVNMPGRTLALREDGSLLVGGFFTATGTIAANRIASLRGGTWSALGDGIDAVVLSICEYGNEIYAGGAFTTSGAVPSLCFARYAPVSAISITTDPVDTHICVPGTLVLAIEASAAGELTYQWRHDGVPIDSTLNPSAATSLLTVVSTLWGDLGTYDCVVSDACASVSCRAAQVSACVGDFNCDGGVDGTDIESFVRAWEAGETFADVNVDGGVDGADVEMFFGRWEAGC